MMSKMTIKANLFTLFLEILA